MGSSRIDQAIAIKSKDVVGSHQSAVGDVININTFPLNEILHFLNRTVVDYWSLDVEGAEAAILEHTDFSKFELGVMTVEHNNDEDLRSKILSIMLRHKFARVGATNQDDYYASPAYFRKRG